MQMMDLDSDPSVLWGKYVSNWAISTASKHAFTFVVDWNQDPAKVSFSY